MTDLNLTKLNQTPEPNKNQVIEESEKDTEIVNLRNKVESIELYLEKYKVEPETAII
jgi:hypothetical protein